MLISLDVYDHLGIKSDGSISYDFFLCLEPINSTLLASSQLTMSIH